MAVTTTVLRREVENNGSETKVNAIVSMTGNYDQLTGIEVEASALGLAQINRAVVNFDSTYVFSASTAADKESVIFRLYDSNSFVGPELQYNSNIFVNTPDNTARLYIENIVGAFSVGEVVTGGTSGATGTVVAVDTDIYGNDRLEIGAPAAGNFQSLENITGGTSGATATTSDEIHITFDIQGILAAPIDLVEGDSAGIFNPLTKSNSFAPQIFSFTYRYDPSPLGQKIETAQIDNFTQIRAAGTQIATGSFSSLQEVLTGFAVTGLGGVPIQFWGK